MLPQMPERDNIMTPGDAARAYGFSDSLLRRYAKIYEDLGGQIHKDTRQGRLYTEDLMEIFSEVKGRVEGGETVEQAMMTLTLEAGEQLDPPTDTVMARSSEAVEALRDLSELPARLERILGEHRQADAKRLEVLEQRQGDVVGLLLAERERSAFLQDTLLNVVNGVGALQQRLEALEVIQEQNRVLDEQNRVLHEEIMALAPSKEDTKAAYVEEMEEIHAELERRNRYLMGELERRDAEAVKVKRSWWKWWG